MFKAPKLFNGEDTTEKSDVFSNAVTLATLFDGGDITGSMRTFAFLGFHTSISASTSPSIQYVIKKCWKNEPDVHPSFFDINDELDLLIESVYKFSDFDPDFERVVLNESFELEICTITGDCEVEHFIRLYPTIQPDYILHNILYHCKAIFRTT